MEKDKFYYYALAYKNQTDVVIVKSPSNNNENKKFLGYEWSNAKGNEGIHYITKSTIKVKDESLEEEDKRILENLQGLKHINTPLYNPEDLEDESKINKIIRDNFNNIKANISTELEAFVSRARLVDMLDFNRVDFNKAISLTEKKVQKAMDSKWELIKLGTIAPYITDKIDFSDIKVKNYISTDNLLQNRKGMIEFSGNLNVTRITQYKENDILISNIRPYLKKIWFADRNAGCSNDVMVFRSSNPKKYLPKYIFYILSTDMFFNYVMSEKQGIKMPRGNKSKIPQFLIPTPNTNTQSQIIQECQKVDDEVVEAKEIVEQIKKEIDDVIDSISGNLIKLGDIVKNLDNLRVPIAKNKRSKGIYPYYGASGIVDYVDKYVIDDYVLLISEDGANLKTRNTPIAFTVKGKAWINNHVHILKFDNKSTHKLVELYLNKIDLSNFITGQAQPKLNQKNMSQIKIPFPALETQKQIVAKIEILESKINDAQKIIDEAQNKKETILKKYL
ncbi:MAG: Type I restriction-modification system, specificity subunit S (EC [uncultured Sulfurovum sp.]|uniref:Type I restriction-modification system, specificity subunit S (EC) n=1 Tax=uncultured Sulfurovum sp. TaxID=269237 RepID=A0A6S6T8L0_9BACT|nr:MAG: Type I restriction-modification system, specificity subunit S (EC [uncultured Sulfurovum sp.]